MSVGLRRHQRFLRTRAIKISVKVSESSAIRVSASVKTSRRGHALRFRRVSRNLAAGKRVTLRLRLSKSSLRKLRRAFRHHRSFIANITVTAHDAAGNSGSRRRAVRLLR